MAKLKIYWNNGAITEIPETSWNMAGTPDMPAVRLEYLLDDLTNGLFVSVRHYAQRPNNTAEPDERGERTYPQNDCFYQVFNREQMEKAICVSLDDVVILRRSAVTNTLMNLAKVNALSQLYVSTDTNLSVYEIIADLYYSLHGKYDLDDESQFMDVISDEMGVPVEDIQEAIRLRECEDQEQDFSLESESFDMSSI